MITRKIVAEEYPLNSSANNLLIISQLGDLAEQYFIHILHTLTTSAYLQNPTRLLTHRYQPYNYHKSAL
jgi:hypothetical protein